MTEQTLRLALALALAIAPMAAQAQAARGAPAAMERVRDVVAERFRELKLSGDPDRDFAAMLAALDEGLIFLAKTHLEYGSDGRLRDLAQSVSGDGQKRVDDLKRWFVRRAEADYKARPDQPPHGSGPLDRGRAATPEAPTSPPPPRTAAVGPAKTLPMVRGRVDDVDASGGKVTIDHERIPNLLMDGMTMIFRVGDQVVLKDLRKGDFIQFTADRVNGQLTAVSIRKGK